MELLRILQEGDGNGVIGMRMKLQQLAQLRQLSSPTPNQTLAMQILQDQMDL
jgi:hypothetical protein